MAPASTKPLAKKLLIKKGDRIATINAPHNYKALLGPLPDGAEIVVRAPLNEGAELVHLFVTTRAELETQLPRARQAMAKNGGIWVSWKKLTAPGAGDVSRDVIRNLAEDNGLKTVRAIAIDDEWSALKLVV
ncbi:MAG: DUF3052 family protein [Alphaproteobacteria bacterium]|nr:DUF3052 family protein [Alphaproteobacteria bacterium]